MSIFDRRLTPKTQRNLRKFKLQKCRIESDLAELSLTEQAYRICELGTGELSSPSHHGLWAMLLRHLVLFAWQLVDEDARHRFVQRDMAKAVIVPFRKNMPLELYAIGCAAKCRLNILQPRDVFFKDEEVENLLKNGSAFTLVSLLYVCGSAHESNVLSEIKRRFTELDMEDRFLLLAEMLYEMGEGRLAVVSASDYAELAQTALVGVSPEILRQLSGESLLAFLNTYGTQEERPPFAMLCTAIETALALPNRSEQDLFAILLDYAQVIVRKKTLLEQFEQTLILGCREHGRTISTVYQLSEFRFFPSTYMATIIKDLRTKVRELDFSLQVHLFFAMCNSGIADRAICEGVMQSYTEVANAYPIEQVFEVKALGPFAADVAIADLLLGTNYFEQFWQRHEACLENQCGYSDLDVILIYRAASSVGIELRGKLRSRAHSRAQVIAGRRPRNSEPEDRFFALVRQALPASYTVEQAGFAHSHHFDLLVTCPDGEQVDHELDDRVHDIRNMRGEELGPRGEDILRDSVLANYPFRVIRTPISILDLASDDAKAAIRQMYGIPG